MKVKISIFFIVSCFIGCSQVTEKSPEKINGVIFDGPANPPITSEMIAGVSASNAEWIATTPEAFTYRNSLEVRSFFSEGQWYGESIEGSLTVIREAKKAGYKVMLKPHMGFTYDLSGWERPENIDFKIEEQRNRYIKSRSDYIATLSKMTKGTWRGDFEPINPDDWDIWEKAYESFILECAKMADTTDVDLFCVGAELNVAAIQRPQFWRELIKKVRDVYDGPILFNANWYRLEEITFWDELDYIGVSAYFPLSEEPVPSLEELSKGWSEHSEKLQKMSRRYSKPVLFAEFGYKSVEAAATTPWLDRMQTATNMEVQSMLYEAMFAEFWEKEWFAGAFLWKWYYSGNGGERSYSPLNKPALDVLKSWYDKD